MTMPPTRTFIATFVLAATAIIAGCATPGSEAPLKPSAPAAAAPARPVADFGASLRCMDNLLVDFAAGRITLDVAEVGDPTRGAPHREQLAAALSSMAMRSRAIRVVADSASLGRNTDSPVYRLRGAAGSDEMDLSAISALDNSVVPGAGARNSVIRVREGSGSRTSSEIRKLGQRFGLPAGADESRALAEISAIEVVGKLTKVPYWSCIGATDREEAVSTEIQDWFDTMVERPAEIIAYFQNQMRARGVYQGPVSGTVNPELKDAVARYREALGFSREPKFSLDFFQAYLSADHREMSSRVQAAMSVAESPAAQSPVPQPTALQSPMPPSPVAQSPILQPPTPPSPVVQSPILQPPMPPSPVVQSPVQDIELRPASAAPAHVAVRTEALAVRVASANAAHRFAKGEAIQFDVRPNRDAHIYCYLQDEDHTIRLVFPNRFRRDSFVPAGGGLQLPGAMGFEINMSEKGGQEALLCLASPRDIFARLSARVAGRDLEPLAAQSLEEIRRAYTAASSGELAHDQLSLAPR